MLSHVGPLVFAVSAIPCLFLYFSLDCLNLFTEFCISSLTNCLIFSWTISSLCFVSTRELRLPSGLSLTQGGGRCTRESPGANNLILPSRDREGILFTVFVGANITAANMSLLMGTLWGPGKPDITCFMIFLSATLRNWE